MSTVTFNLQATNDVNAMGSLIFNPASTTNINSIVIDSLQVVNTTNYDTAVDIIVKRSDGSSYFFIKKRLFEGYAQGDVLFDSCLYLSPSDQLFASTMNSKQRIDCLVSYRMISN